MQILRLRVEKVFLPKYGSTYVSFGVCYFFIQEIVQKFFVGSDSIYDVAVRGNFGAFHWTLPCFCKHDKVRLG